MKSRSCAWYAPCCVLHAACCEVTVRQLEGSQTVGEIRLLKPPVSWLVGPFSPTLRCPSYTLKTCVCVWGGGWPHLPPPAPCASQHPGKDELTKQPKKHSISAVAVNSRQHSVLI